MITSACGVDFGTSNSTVGWCRTESHPQASPLLALEEGKPTLPSAIFFHDDDEDVSHGRAALADYLAGYDGRLMRSMKSLLGSSLMDGTTEVRGRPMPFRALLTAYIRELRDRAQGDAKRVFTQAVFGRPVFFVDDDAAADKLAEDTLGEIARDVGFTDVAFQFEPLAAAFDYESRIQSEELVLVVDIGGGTSDFSLVRLSPARAHLIERRDDILANGGVHIGGTDFDKQFSLTAVMPMLGLGGELVSGKQVPAMPYIHLASWHTINNVYTRKMQDMLRQVRAEAVDKDRLDLLLRLVQKRAGHWLAHQMEQAKIGVSDNGAADVSLDRLAQGLSVSLTRADLDRAIDQLVTKVDDTVGTLLTDAGIRADQVDTVFFTGGSSRVPLLRERIGARLAQARHVEGDVFGSIGSGLALDAARRFPT